MSLCRKCEPGFMHASVNVGFQGKSGPGKIHEVILVPYYNLMISNF